MKVPEMLDNWYLNFDYNLASSTSNKKRGNNEVSISWYFTLITLSILFH